jgi:hypothetical protein
VQFDLLKCVIFVPSSNTYLLHHELLNFMLIAMSTQLLYWLSPGPSDTNPFIDAAMVQVSGWPLALFFVLSSELFRSYNLFMDVFHNLLESSLVNLVVGRLLLNYIVQHCIPFNSTSYPVFSDKSQPGALQRVGSVLCFQVWVIFIYQTTNEGISDNALWFSPWSKTEHISPKLLS